MRLRGLTAGYVNYNVVAKKLGRRLAALGSQELLPGGLGDDQHPSGYEASLDPWLRQLWTHLRTLHPLSPGLSDVRSGSPVTWPPVLSALVHPAIPVWECAVSQPDETAVATLDTPCFRVTVLPALHASGHANGRADEDEQAEALAAAYEFGQVEAAAAGIGQRHDTLAEPLCNGSTGRLWGSGQHRSLRRWITVLSINSPRHAPSAVSAFALQALARAGPAWPGWSETSA